MASPVLLVSLLCGILAHGLDAELSSPTGIAASGIGTDASAEAISRSIQDLFGLKEVPVQPTAYAYSLPTMTTKAPSAHFSVVMSMDQAAPSASKAAAAGTHPASASSDQLKKPVIGASKLEKATGERHPSAQGAMVPRLARPHKSSPPQNAQKQLIQAALSFEKAVLDVARKPTPATQKSIAIPKQPAAPLQQTKAALPKATSTVPTKPALSPSKAVAPLKAAAAAPLKAVSKTPAIELHKTNVMPSVTNAGRSDGGGEKHAAAKEAERVKVSWPLRQDEDDWAGDDYENPFPARTKSPKATARVVEAAHVPSSAVSIAKETAPPRASVPGKDGNGMLPRPMAQSEQHNTTTRTKKVRATKKSEDDDSDDEDDGDDWFGLGGDDEEDEEEDDQEDGPSDSHSSSNLKQSASPREDSQPGWFSSLITSVAHRFYCLFGPDKPVVPPSSSTFMMPKPPASAQQDIDGTAVAAARDGLADVTIHDSWEAQEREDASIVDRVKREDRALRMDAETVKQPAAPPVYGDVRFNTGSTHISDFWQKLVNEDTQIKDVLSESGEDLTEYERLVGLQDAKVAASVSEISGPIGARLEVMESRNRLRQQTSSVA